MHFVKGVVFALTAFTSTLALAAPAPEAEPEALEKRTCPRTEKIGAAQEIASLYLGEGNNKSNQVQRLIEELVALLEGKHPICEYKKVYLDCDDGKHWGWGQSDPHYKRDALPWDDKDKDDKECKKYPYKKCQIKCYGKEKC